MRGFFVCYFVGPPAGVIWGFFRPFPFFLWKFQDHQRNTKPGWGGWSYPGKSCQRKTGWEACGDKPSPILYSGALVRGGMCPRSWKDSKIGVPLIVMCLTCMACPTRQLQAAPERMPMRVWVWVQGQSTYPRPPVMPRGSSSPHQKA